MWDQNRPKEVVFAAAFQQGFTLLEVIAVLVLIALLGVVGLSRLGEDTSKVVTQTEVIKSQIRFAQSCAMHLGGVWGIQSTGSTYWLFRNGNTTDQASLPNETALTVSLADKGLSTLTGFTTISFDFWGTPYTDPGATTKLTSALTVSVSDGTTSPKSFTITPDTGFIP